MTRRNVAIVVPRYLPHLGGIENHVAQLADRLQDLGHQVTVATQTEGDTRSPRLERRPNGVIVRRFRSGLKIKGQGFSPALWRWVNRGADGADIIHVQNFHALTTLAIIASARPPIVFTPHYLGAAEGFGSRLIHRTYALLMRRAMHKVARIVCVSSSELAGYSSDVGPGARCTVIPNGVDTRSIQAVTPVPTSGRLLVVAGRLEPYKRHSVVLEALAHLPDTYRLAIVGTGSLSSALRNRASELGLSERVHLTGQLAPPDLYAYYRAADVVLSTSERECFGLTIAEGLAAGASVVASDIGAHRDVVELAGALPLQARLLPIQSSPGEVADAVLAVAGRGADVPAPALPDWDWVAKETASMYEDAILSRAAAISPGYAAGRTAMPTDRHA